MKDTTLLEVMARWSVTGEIEVQLAEKYLGDNEWGKAVIILKRALAKGGLDDISYAYLLLADAHSKLDQIDLAENYYYRALASVLK